MDAYSGRADHSFQPRSITPESDGGSLSGGQGINGSTPNSPAHLWGCGLFPLWAGCLPA